MPKKSQTAKSVSFKSQYSRLSKILELLEDNSADLDNELKLYEEGLGLISDLEKFLKTAENKIKIIQSKNK